MKEATVIGYTISEKSFENQRESCAAIFLEAITSVAEANKVLEKGRTFIDAKEHEYDLLLINKAHRYILSTQEQYGKQRERKDALEQSRASYTNIVQYIAQSENLKPDFVNYNPNLEDNISVILATSKNTTASSVIPVMLDLSIYLTDKQEPTTEFQKSLYSVAPIAHPNTEGKEWLPLPYNIGKFNSETGIWCINVSRHHSTKQQRNVTNLLEDQYGSTAPIQKPTVSEHSWSRYIEAGVLSPEGLAKLIRKTEKRLNAKPRTTKPKVTVKFNAGNLKGIVYNIDRSPIMQKLKPKKLYWMAADYSPYGLQRDISRLYKYTLGWIVMLYRLLPKEQFLELFGNMFDEVTTEALLAKNYTAATTRVKEARTIITILRIAIKHYRHSKQGS